MFIDKAVIKVQAGNGGSGCVSFRREKYVAKGGPNGGDGGNGGNVVLQADPNLSTLLDFKYKPHFKAGRAEHGKGSNCHGKNGQPLLVKVPLGTVIRDQADGTLLADLTDANQSVVAARGGHGGRGNARFASSTNQAPRHWESGEFGEEKILELELKLIADVGLVGLPNSGKSTLISKLSHAKPKIADYPFTTLKPNLGIVKYRDVGSYVVADIPGIIEGAHLGKGLGHEFLRHIERTKLLLVLLDCSADDLYETYLLLQGELEQYQDGLPGRIHSVLLTKSDLQPEADFSELVSKLPVPVRHISSVTGAGITELKDEIWSALQTIVE